MPAYRVKFSNRLLSSDGHPISAVQRVIRVPRADSPEDACRIAQAQFAALERIEHWSQHAQCCECEVDENGNGPQPG
ncbi:MAG TPA: hypothetical protein VE224_04445 [Pseudolabrys sp.]|nr:hypothetical protein [Pseudolabrys sp.]